ncbi:BetA Choline dehydrogenase and related flavoproteins [Burkholderiales bacterium]
MEFDSVIVGAGSAGCLLANRLSANPRHRVLLIEAGGEDDWHWIKIPVGYLFTIANPRTDWCFQTAPDPGLRGRSIHYARGKVLGGCSSINAMIYMRGQASDYDRWAEATSDPRWKWSEETLSIYKSLEDFFGGANEWHGASGEMRVESARVRWKILDAWQMAAQQAGIAPIEEFNRGDNAGSAYFHVTQRRGRRWSMADAFLHPIRHRANLTVMTHAQVTKLILDDQAPLQQPNTPTAWRGAALRATGVEVLRGGRSITIQAREQVVLSAGAISSPHLLQASGVGPAQWLADHQIPLRLQSEGVGRNLQDHLQIRTVYRISGVPTVNTLYRNPFTRLGMGLQYLLFRTGPMTMPPSTLGAFAKSDPGQASANLEWHLQPLSLPKFGEPLHPFGAITPSVCNLRPSSRGQVQIQSADPLKPPKIDCRYLSTEEDLQVALAGLRKTREIMRMPALAPFCPEELLPGPDRISESDLIDSARDLGTTIFHPVGTCAMGQNGHEQAVLDTDLRFRGIQNLRVVDASAMPTITSGNTNAPVMLMAERAARSMHQDLGL